MIDQLAVADQQNELRWDAWCRAGALSTSMESAALMVVASIRVLDRQDRAARKSPGGKKTARKKSRRK